jgi:ribonuclease HI
MELYAVLRAIEETSVGSEIHIHTDSRLVIGWLTKDWKANKTYIEETRDAIFAILEAKDIKMRLFKVKGHNGHPMNEKADRLAVIQSKKIQH